MTTPIRSTDPAASTAANHRAVPTPDDLARALPPLSRRKRVVARILVLFAALAAASWLVWRFATVGLHPLRWSMLVIELSGWMAGFMVARGMLRAGASRGMECPDPTYRYACAVADRVGRTRIDDVRQDLRSVVSRVRSRETGSLADRAMVGVLIDGPRRVALVAGLSACLLLGVAPLPVPPAPALAAAGSAAFALAVGHRMASDRAVRLGDRTRWSFASLGEVLSAPDADVGDHAPRRWIGTVASIVLLNLCIALRGISDRWTHGLPSMTDDERLVAIGWASLVMLGGLYALRTIPTPDLRNAHLIARRHEERVGRWSALGAAVVVGAVGLFAGVMPLDADLDGPVEQPLQVDGVDQGGVTGG